VSESIVGKVIRILNDREIVLNRGLTNGLAEGDYIGVIDPETEDMTDPDTGENLGSIRRYKVALRISQVSERLAIAATYKTKEVNVGGMGDPTRGIFGVSQMMAPRKIVTEVERLRLNERAAKPIGPSESRVQEGDLFEVITKDTAESGFTIVML